MKFLLVLSAAALVATGCANDRRGAVQNVEGARSPFADPANNTLNSPATGPSSAGLPGGPIGSPPNVTPSSPVAAGRR